MSDRISDNMFFFSIKGSRVLVLLWHWQLSNAGNSIVNWWTVKESEQRLVTRLNKAWLSTGIDHLKPLSCVTPMYIRLVYCPHSWSVSGRIFFIPVHHPRYILWHFAGDSREDRSSNALLSQSDPQMFLHEFSEHIRYIKSVPVGHKYRKKNLRIFTKTLTQAHTSFFALEHLKNYFSVRISDLTKSSNALLPVLTKSMLIDVSTPSVRRESQACVLFALWYL